MVPARGPAQENNPLPQIIEANRATFGPWVDHPDSFEVQVLYTQIDRMPGGRIKLRTHRWGSDSTQYFYPASTVKMPVAVLALQHLNELGVIGLDAHTPLFHGVGNSPQAAPQTAVKQDTSCESGLPSVAHYVRKIFLASDNDAYNRLFEWLGPSYLNQALHLAGIQGGRIQHRVGVSGFDTETHAYLNPVRFAQEDRTLLEIAERHDYYFDPLEEVRGQHRGLGFTRGDSLINEPFDFSHKNYLSLRNLHDILVRIVLPEAIAPEERFVLTPEDRNLLLRAMTQRPRESKSPRYDKPDNYVKFWLYGDRPEGEPIPGNVRILNKVGWAYGYLTDAAYITDGDTEFILVGTIHTNANRIYNDGNYEYKKIGLPFFGQLGRAIYDYELDRVGD